MILRSIPWLSLEWNLWTFEGVQKQAARYVFANSVPFAEYNRLLAEHGFVVREIVPIDAQSAMTIAEKVNVMTFRLFGRT